VPNLHDAYYNELDQERWSLVPVAQLDTYKGLVFATFDPGAPPLLDYLGAMTWYLDTFFDRREGGIEVIGGMHKWVVPCNWKMPAENFAGDAYHVGWTHLSSIRSGFSVGVTAQSAGGGAMVSPGNGHGLITVGANDSPDPPMAVLKEYEEQIRPEVDARLGPRYRQVSPIVGTVFPNFSMLRASSCTFRVWHPKGPGRMEIWAWAYVDKAAPPEVKEAIRLGAIRGFSPSGTFEQDDMDNWQECTQSYRGVVARRRLLNYQMGIGHESFNEDFDALTSDHRYSDSNHRQFYHRWGQLMAAKSWADL
jgi:3-phenylpropionate/trans-cinnamate dioxygenase alpha subunit